MFTHAIQLGYTTRERPRPTPPRRPGATQRSLNGRPRHADQIQAYFLPGHNRKTQGSFPAPFSAWVALWAASLPAAAHSVICYPEGLESVLDQLERKLHEKPVGLGTSQTGALAVLTITQSGDGWSLIVAKPDGQACMLDSGHNWESLKPLPGPQT